jgi:hypothetical protein
MFCYIHPEIPAEILRLFDRKKTISPLAEESGIDKNCELLGPEVILTA